MAKAFKPTVMYFVIDGNGVRQTKTLTLPTYAEVKKRMKAFMNESMDENVHVYRHRRGEWGEWFEFWVRRGGKCEISHKGWQ
jgi:hypothetical protein